MAGSATAPAPVSCQSFKTPVGWVYNVDGEACRQKVLTSDTHTLATYDPRSEILTVSSPTVHRCLKLAHYGYILGTRPRLRHTEPSSWDF
eukprot:4093838-Pyramimonas_sp.AAC.1